MGQFVYNTLAALVELDSTIRYTFYVADETALAALPRRSGLRARLIKPGLYPLWEQVLLPVAVARDRVDLLYAPANTAPLIIPAPTRLVLTIHDAMFLLPSSQLPTSPSLYQRLGRAYRAAIVPRVAHHADRVTTVSSFSGDDLAQRLGLKRSSISVVYESANPVFYSTNDRSALDAVRDRLRLPRSFVLALGAVDPRKNTAAVLEAFALARPSMAEQWGLVVTGLSGSFREQVVAQAQRLGIADVLVPLGFVTEEELAALYNLAELLLYPSLYEGFGLPIIEAMACGTPVISSALTSIPEVAGDAALLVEPTDISAIAEALISLLNQPSRREELRQRGFAQIQAFSWERTAGLLLEAFYGALSR